MRTPKAAQGKIQNEGALRGARNTTIVKIEPLAVQPASRQLLKNSIIQRRRARGESDIENLFDFKEVKHDLTPEEVEKKERRKEQNRRAARRCRAKKKLLQVDVAQSFANIQEENQRLEEEVEQLKREKNSIENQLKEHMLSGNCKHVKNENSHPLSTQNHTLDTKNHILPPCQGTEAGRGFSGAQFSPTNTQQYTVPPNVFTQVSTQVSTPPSSQILPFDQNTYLADLGPIEPSETFMDLGNLDLKSGGFPIENIPASEPTTTAAVCKSFDTVNLRVLESLLPRQSLCVSTHLLCPVSPGTDRHSVSSVSSEWSAISEQSRGFSLDGSGEPANQRLSTSLLYDAEERRVQRFGQGEDLVGGLDQYIPARTQIQSISDEDDDVFSDYSSTVTNEDYFRQYMNY